MGEIIGKGGSVVDLNWVETQPGSGQYGAVVRSLPDKLSQFIDTKVSQLHEIFRKEVLQVAKDAKKMEQKEISQINNLIRSGAYQSLTMNTSIGEIIYVWSIKDLEDVKRKFTDKNINTKLSSLTENSAQVYKNVLARVIGMLKHQLDVLNPILVSENIKVTLRTQDPKAFYPKISENELMKSLAYTIFKSIPTK